MTEVFGTFLGKTMTNHENGSPALTWPFDSCSPPRRSWCHSSSCEPQGSEVQWLGSCHTDETKNTCKPNIGTQQRTNIQIFKVMKREAPFGVSLCCRESANFLGDQKGPTLRQLLQMPQAAANMANKPSLQKMTSQLQNDAQS